MKRYILFVFIGAFTHISNAQTTEALVTPNDTVVSENVSFTDARLVKQEQEVQTLKKDTEAIKKEIKQLKSALSIGSKNRFTISRKGSKQIVVE